MGSLGLPQILVGLVSFLGMITMLVLLWALGACGSWCSASRIGSKAPAIILICSLGAELYVFEAVCMIDSHWRALFDALLFVTVWSILRTMYTDPGTSQSPEWLAWKSEHRTDGTKLTSTDDEAPEGEGGCFVDAVETETRTFSWNDAQCSWCEHCKLERPERAHHCRRCGLCVLRMDHHCPMMGNCIGFRNHKYFMLMHWWGFWTSIAFLITPKGPGWTALLPVAVGDPQLDLNRLLSINFSVGWALILMLLTGPSWISAASLMMRNRTFLESDYRGKNPYFLEPSIENIKQVVGPINLRMLLPLEPVDRICNGTRFPTSAEINERRKNGWQIYGTI